MIIYTDGSAHPNPGPGGYGVVVYNDENKIIDAYSHYETQTTNNEQELKAILYTMIHYGKNEFCTPVVYSDSAYAINTLTNWMFNWEKNGWRKSDKKIPENLALIKTYFDLYSKGYRIDLRKIKGHEGIEGNELADKLASGKIKCICQLKDNNKVELDTKLLKLLKIEK